MGSSQFGWVAAVCVFSSVPALAAPGFATECGSPSVLATPPRAAGSELGEAVAAIFRRERPMRVGSPKACTNCHNADEAAGGTPNLLDFGELRRAGLVDATNPKDSRLYKALSRADNRFMPRGGADRISRAELDTIEEWMKAGSPNAQISPSARLPGVEVISETDIIDCLAQDLARLPQAARKNARYFTLTHFYNAKLGQELAAAAEALSKLINSLSWEPTIAKPIAVDPAGTVFRVSLGAYGWDAAKWKKILAKYPYAIRLDYRNARFVYEETDSGSQEIPYVRADWFLFEASKPPLYHDLLQLPSTSIALEARLGIDVAKNLEQGAAIRAGFAGRPVSGVATHNRLIERHPISAGAYWKSYDFTSSEDQQSLFEHPLDFAHAGGEIIFNLPNGLQAYLLTLANGNRIGAAPVTIVQGPRRRDGNITITNGISCMGCHTAGVNRATDQIRTHVESHPDLFAPIVTKQVQLLYRPQSELNTLFAQDETRFTEAVAKTGGRAGGTDESIFSSAENFDGSLDLERFAAELGITAEELRGGLRSNPRLARQLGFETRGRTVSRRQFDQLFATNVTGFRLGQPVTAGAAAPAPEENYQLSPSVTWNRQAEACSSLGTEWTLVDRPDQLEQGKRWEAMGRNESVQVWTSLTKEPAYDVTCGVRLPPPNHYRTKSYSVSGYHGIEHTVSLSRARYSNMNICVYTNGLATGEMHVTYRPRETTVATLRLNAATLASEVVEQSEGVFLNVAYPAVCVNRPRR